MRTRPAITLTAKELLFDTFGGQRLTLLKVISLCSRAVGYTEPHSYSPAPTAGRRGGPAQRSVDVPMNTDEAISPRRHSKAPRCR
jgi:hypothetical protein